MDNCEPIICHTVDDVKVIGRELKAEAEKIEEPAYDASMSPADMLQQARSVVEQLLRRNLKRSLDFPEFGFRVTATLTRETLPVPMWHLSLSLQGEQSPERVPNDLAELICQGIFDREYRERPAFLVRSVRHFFSIDPEASNAS